MESYYSRQAVMPHFPGHTGQRESGLGSSASGVGRVVLPLAKKVLLPTAKSIGKELSVQSLPETMGIATKKAHKQAAKSAVKKTVKKQIGGSASIKKSKPVKRNSRRKKQPQTSRSNFFSRVRNVTQRFTC